MVKQEVLDLITQIGTCEDDVQRRTLLADLSEGVSTDYDSLETLKQENTQYMQDNETLRAANMKLFLKVGEQKTNAEQQINSTGIENKEPEKLNFEDLLDEKGGLK